MIAAQLVKARHFKGLFTQNGVKSLHDHSEIPALVIQIMIKRGVEAGREKTSTIRRVFIPATSDSEARDFAEQLRVPEMQPGDSLELIRPDGTMVAKRLLGER
ncbi:hypothetical protein [Methylorubrum extorquens]|uniref:hypothetical protein n=1 Tax=Methylorubrum extorquens TaxID=408 RepID=UPI001EE5EBE5|nr:hypothetical protein [Methylorubrum extorquens]MCG5244759.1 hypothetical protein [Methylorubrum extorquens]